MEKTRIIFFLLLGVNLCFAENDVERGDQPAAAQFFSKFEHPEKKGLALFDSLEGGNPFTTNSPIQLRSLDGGESDAGIQESSRVRKTFKRRTSRKNVQQRAFQPDTNNPSPIELRSGYESTHSAPHHFLSEEVVYRRSNNARSRTRSRSTNSGQLRSLNSNGNGCRSQLNCATATSSARIAASDEGFGHTQLRSLSTASSSARESEGLRLYNKLIEEGGARDKNSDEVHYHKSIGTRRRSGSSTRRRSSSSTTASNSNANLVRSLSSPSSSQTSRVSGNGLNCVLCRSQTSSSSNQLRNLDTSASTYQAPAVPAATVAPYIPSRSGSSLSWHEKEERSHSAKRTISHTVNGVETNGLGEPYVSQEEGSYRREAAGGTDEHGNSYVQESKITNPYQPQPAQTQTRSLDLNQGRSHAEESSAAASSLSESSSSSSSSQTSSSTMREQRQSQRLEPQIIAAPTLSVGNYNDNRRRARYNCSQYSTSSLSEGSVTAAELVTTPAPCLIRRRTCANCEQTRTTQTRSNNRRLEIPNPPVQTLGHGQDEVQARVLHNEEEEHETSSSLTESNHFNGHQPEDEQEHHSTWSEEEQRRVEEEEEERQRILRQQRVQALRSNGARRNLKKAYYRRTVFKNFTTEEHENPGTLQVTQLHY